MDLPAYERLKDSLADLLRAVPWRPEQAERNRDLFARLAEDRFNLTVIGRFSRGKSTLMNAMLGVDRLPTGIEPLTSVITSVTYGSHEKVVIHFQDTTLFLDIRLDQLEEYATERGNPGNRRRVREAEIQLPADLLRGGFRFIDTPGLGSPVAGNSLTTQAFLPEADAILLVTGFDAALTEEEAAILVMARQAARRVFVVVNKADLLDEPARRAALDELARRLDRLGLPDEPLYPVSARQALAVRIGRRPIADLPASGLPLLEADIIAFLTRSQRSAFLDGMCARIEAVLGAEPEGEAGSGAALSRLRQIRAAIAMTDKDQAVSGAAPPGDGLGANLPACPVCEQVEAALFDALARLQGALRRDQSARDELVRQGGFCGPHGRQFAADAAPREVCLAIAPLLDDRAAGLRRLASSAGPADLAALLPGHPSCPACGVAVREADQAIDAHADRLRSHPSEAARLAILCLPHLARLVSRLDRDPVVPVLLERQALLLERRAGDMRRFALKQDAALRDRISDEERHAAGRGLAALAGAPGADHAPGSR